LILVCDLETTSLNVFEAEIVTGYFAILDEKLNVVDSLSIQCNPWKWSDEAEKIHGITKRQASKYKKFYEVYEDIVNFIYRTKATEFWCHSNSVMYGKIVPYDYAVLRLNMLNMGDNAYWTINALRPYSTHSLAKVLSDRFTFEGYSLDNVCRSLGIKLNHHNAESDCLASVDIIKKLLPLTSRDELYNYERGINEDASRTRKRDLKKSKPSNGIVDHFSNHI
jgi:DNA polymerase III epsilon subunit-like protein